jgi:predicted RNA-binding Zn-ribbon protein involved in translation (DUF1610 family)
MMLKKVVSLALAISMFATAFVAIGAAGATPVVIGGIVAVNAAGTPQTILFNGDTVYFVLTYSVDGLPTNAEFNVELLDGGGNVISTKAGIWTNWPADGQYMSNFTVLNGFGLANGPDTRTLRAILVEPQKIIAETSFKLMAEQVIVAPETSLSMGSGPIHAPGETVTIKIDVFHPDGANSKVNVTVTDEIGGVDDVNVSWNEVVLTNYHAEIVWTIPNNITTGPMRVYVNRSDDWNFNLYHSHYAMDIEYFWFQVTWDRSPAIYLPGETALGSYWAKQWDNFTSIDAALDVNMTYNDGSGALAWQNQTVASSPFNVTIPTWISSSGGGDIDVDYKAYAGANRTSTLSGTIDVGTVRINDIVLDRPGATYYPGDSVVLKTEVWVQDLIGGNSHPLPDATVMVTLDDGMGNLLPVNATATTDSGGWADVTMVLPANLTENQVYRFIVKASKLGFWDTESIGINYMSGYTIEVTVDKDKYIVGEDISVSVLLLKNGVIVNPDLLWYCVLGATGVPDWVWETTTNVNFTIVAPKTNDDTVRVHVTTWIGNQWIADDSPNFAITTIQVLLSASEMEYYAGDSVDFGVLVVGNSAGYILRYTIVDNDLILIGSGTLTLAADNTSSFTLDVPVEKNAEAYTATVYATNGANDVVIEDLTVTRAVDYQVILNIKTAPVSVSGAYAPGQTIVVAFEIIKQSSDLPDLAVVTAELYDDDDDLDGERGIFTAMSGELSITLADEAFTGRHWLGVWIAEIGPGGTTFWQSIMVDSQANGSLNSNIGGMMSLGDLMLVILMVIVIIMLLWQMIKGRGAAGAAAGAEKKPAEPKEAKDSYAPKATVACASCGSPIEVATSKRPIEVMCPKCGKSQMVN